jgi:4-amino-4-deoxy-L-arabinose transferase-like glycosyltransferase
MDKIKQYPWIWLVVAIALAILLKVGLMLFQAFPFNSDEAIVAIMARHIQSGENPIFFYGQAYMGSLDAYIIALFFWIFGQQVWVIRLVQILLYIGTVATTYWLGKLIAGSHRIAGISALLMAVPSVNLTLYTTVTLGGYGEALLIGNLILLFSLMIAREIENDQEKADQNVRVWFRNRNFPGFLPAILGFLWGLGFWANGLTLVYSVPSFIYLSATLIRKRGILPKKALARLGFVFPGFLVGSLPLWIYIYKSGFMTLVHEYLGSSIAVETGSWLEKVVNHLINFILLGVPVILGFRPSWTVTWLVLPLIPFVLFFWAWVLVNLVRTIRKRNAGWKEYLLIIGVPGFILMGFLFTSFGADPSGRYFLPFAVPMSILAAQKIHSSKMNIGKWSWAILAFLIGFHLFGTLQVMFAGPQSFTTQFDATTIIDHRYDEQLIDFLKQNGEHYGYSNYWTAYPIDFLSNEEIVLIPKLPYHADFRYTSRDDRYPPYDSLVEQSKNVAYITAHFPELDDRIRQALRTYGITWKEQVIGDYRVFYHLSTPLRPDQINLKQSGS